MTCITAADEASAEGGAGPVMETGSLPGGAGVWADPPEEKELSEWKAFQVRTNT